MESPLTPLKTLPQNKSIDVGGTTALRLPKQLRVDPWRIFPLQVVTFTSLHNCRGCTFETSHPHKPWSGLRGGAASLHTHRILQELNQKCSRKRDPYAPVMNRNTRITVRCPTLSPPVHAIHPGTNKQASCYKLTIPSHPSRAIWVK